jgi:phosphoribosylamine-glycine ligase
LEKAMLKFRSTQETEVWISSAGCLVIKQDSVIDGKEVTVVLTPDQAEEIKMLVIDFYDEMAALWNGGLIKEDEDEQSSN